MPESALPKAEEMKAQILEARESGGKSISRLFLILVLPFTWVEQNKAFVPLIKARLVEQAQTDEVIIQVSGLTEMECLVMPLRKQDQLLLNKFRRWFGKVEVLPVEREVFRRAAQLRADFVGLKTPGAIHLATALHFGSDEFWTNDNRLAHIAPSLVIDITTT